MKKLITLMLVLLMGNIACAEVTEEKQEKVILPQVQYKSEVSLEKALYNRESVRNYGCKAVTLENISQLLWAAQGTSKSGKRTAPSAYAKYPLNIYAVVGKVDDLAAGLYRYDPKEHQLVKLKEGDLRKDLVIACQGQGATLLAPASIVITSSHKENTAYLEVGHVAQNVYLQATALDLGTAVVAVFNEQAIDELIGLDENNHTIYVMPVGSKPQKCGCKGGACKK